MNHTQAMHPIMQAAEREEDLLLEQQQDLREPQGAISAIDPITGNPIDNPERKPSLTEGNLTIYFESEQTRQTYLDMQKHKN